MGQVLVEYEGSKPGTTHQIIKGNDGVVYCTCWPWKRNRTCKHLDRFYSQFERKAMPSSPTIPTPKVATGITANLNTADDIITSLDPKVWTKEKGA